MISNRDRYGLLPCASGNGLSEGRRVSPGLTIVVEVDIVDDRGHYLKNRVSHERNNR